MGVIKGVLGHTPHSGTKAVLVDSDGKIYTVGAETFQFADLNPTATNVEAITNASTTYTLPTPAGLYKLIAVGNSCYVTEGATPTATVGGKGIYCPEGVWTGPFKITGPVIAVIASVTAGNLYIVELSDEAF